MFFHNQTPIYTVELVIISIFIDVVCAAAVKKMFLDTNGISSDEDVRPNVESIADFYAGKSVFITGVTGFLGKVYLEKLLYSCKDIDKVFVIIRNKKGEDGEKRIEKLLDSPAFSRIKSYRPEDLKKVIPILGDIKKPELGISSEDQEKLINEVSIVFHVAASVNLDADLKTSMITNYFGTKHILNLCHRMKNIKVFVHVSTAYSNTVEKVLEEKVYPPPAQLDVVLKYMEEPHLDRNRLKKFLKGRPNTYTFSKALAEHYVAENHGDIPTIIIRPSTVTCSSKEPMPGWVDNFQGATALITAILKGVNKVIYGNKNNVLDLIPVDYVANLSIVAAAKINSSRGITVHNCCTSSIRPLTLKQIEKYICQRSAETEQNLMFRATVFFPTNRYFDVILTFLLQIIPSYIADVFLRVTGKKPKYMKIQSKVLQGRKVLNYFTKNTWIFKSDSSRQLLDSLSPSDRLMFPCYPSDLNWDEYFETYFEGIDKFLLKVK